MRHMGIDFRAPAVEPVANLRNVDFLGWLDPGQAAESGYARPGRNSDEATGVPSDTAVADARCRVETGYSDVRREVFVEAQNRVIAQNRARLGVVKALNQARLANSAKVLDGTLTLSW